MTMDLEKLIQVVQMQSQQQQMMAQQFMQQQKMLKQLLAQQTKHQDDVYQPESEAIANSPRQQEDKAIANSPELKKVQPRGLFPRKRKMFSRQKTPEDNLRKKLRQIINKNYDEKFLEGLCSHLHIYVCLSLLQFMIILHDQENTRKTITSIVNLSGTTCM